MIASSAAALLGRLLLAQLFLWEGIFRIRNYAAAVMYVERFAMPGNLLPIVIALQIGGALMLITGFGTRLAAFALAAFCAFAALVFHTKLADLNQIQHLQKDLALAGGLLILSANGPGRWALRGHATSTFGRLLHG